jgi:hypothetical protein
VTNAPAAFLVEIFPYAQRTMGIGIEQIFGKAGGFFSTNVNPLALTAINWKYFAIYCGWIFFELLTVYFLYPETYNRTLEELTFRMSPCSIYDDFRANVMQSLRTRTLSRSRLLLRKSNFKKAICPPLAKRTTLWQLSALSRLWHLATDAERSCGFCVRNVRKWTL